jgi:tryptophan-rich sensory protein
MSFAPATETPSIPDRLPRVLASLLLPALAAAVGGAATARNVNDWYPTLRKPSWNPPGAIFGPVWTTLYLMMGIADAIVASHPDAERAGQARRIYKLQLGLNALWSVLFFGLRRPGMALLEIVVLWVAIALTIGAFWRVSRLAALLLVPYLLWTTFATALNASIWWKNR